MCQLFCDRSSGCEAYEWGQTGGYCQLIHPSGGSGVCPSGWSYNPKGDGASSITQTYHDTGGRCYLKAGMAFAWVQLSIQNDTNN